MKDSHHNEDKTHSEKGEAENEWHDNIIRSTEKITKLSDVYPVPEWKSFLNTVKKKERIIVIGSVDSGKTSFCRYVISHFESPAVLDFDPGQQNLFLPSTVSAKFGKRFLKFFIGKFSPRGAENLVLVALKLFLRELEGENPEITVLDTSGYVKDDRAVFLKLAKCLIFNPTKVVILKTPSPENHSYIEKIKKVLSLFFEVYELPSSEHSRSISREERDEIRTRRLQMYFSESEDIELKKEGETKPIVNLDLYPPSETGKELIGFFRGGFTEFLGLVQSEDESVIRVRVPKHHKNWDFIIRSGLKVKI